MRRSYLGLTALGRWLQHVGHSVSSLKWRLPLSASLTRRKPWPRHVQSPAQIRTGSNVHFRIVSLQAAFAVIVVSFFAIAQTRGQNAPPPPPAGVNLQSDLFEVSVGFNYIYLHDQFPETKNLYGVEGSLFINATSWLSTGGEFIADFGSHSLPKIFGNTIDIDSQRYVYVFGPRVTLWRNPQFRVFAEALAGGVHAEAQLTAVNRYFIRNASASADGFAMVLGGGFDWRLTNHLSWRIVQADYLGTDLSSQWQSNFRASTSIAYSFGQR